MLHALQKLRLDGKSPPWYKAGGPRDIHYCTLSEKRLALKLPNLVSLHLRGWKKGRIGLSCPKLSELSMLETHSLQVEIKDAALESLVLLKCSIIQFAWNSPQIQLQSIKTLFVTECFEEGRHLIQDVSQMIHLESLTYRDFLVYHFEDPAGCMPPSFPQSLQKINIDAYDWCRDLPRGLKELHELRKFSFTSMCRPWHFTVPLARFLPVDSLETVIVGCEEYCRSDEAKWRELEECTLGVLTDYA